MELSEVCMRFGLNATEISDYYHKGWIGSIKEGKIVLSDCDINKIGCIRFFKEAGLKDNQVDKIICGCNDAEALNILLALREKALSSIHEKQKLIDTIDCFIYRIKHK